MSNLQHSVLRPATTWVARVGYIFGGVVLPVLFMFGMNAALLDFSKGDA